MSYWDEEAMACEEVESEYDDHISISSDEEEEEEGTLPRSLQDWKQKLCECLDDIQSGGEFASLVHEDLFPHPGLRLHNGQDIRLPLASEDAEALKSVCRQAPFGKGDETLVDTSVRDTWELDFTQFKIRNPAWSPFLDGLVKSTADKIGLFNIQAKPHKLLLYEKGSFFKKHQDSEKETGMLGTLVVCLPSQHEGGQVDLSFAGQRKTFHTGPHSEFDLSAMAWYSDVTHQIKPLVSGYRLVLTYKLVKQQSGMEGAIQSAQDLAMQSQELGNLLSRHSTMLHKFPMKFPGMLLYPLDHKYTQSSLCLNNLKGRDLFVCRSIQQHCKKYGLILLFAHLTHTETEDFDEYDDYYQDCETPGTELDIVYSSDGYVIASDHVVSASETLLRSDHFKSRDPDSEDEGEFTGNESAPSTYRYHDTVAVLLPISSLAELAPPTRDTFLDFLSFLILLLRENPEDLQIKKFAKDVYPKVLNNLSSPLDRSIFVHDAQQRVLNLGMLDLYGYMVRECRPFMTPTIAEGIIVTLLLKIEMDGGKDRSDWDTLFGPLATISSLSAWQRSTDRVSNDLKIPDMRQSFLSWARPIFNQKLAGQPLELDDIETLMTVLRSAQADPEEFIRVRRMTEFSLAQVYFNAVLEATVSSLGLTWEALQPFERLAGKIQTHIGLGEFLNLIDSCLEFGMEMHTRDLIMATHSNFNHSLHDWTQLHLRDLQHKTMPFTGSPNDLNLVNALLIPLLDKLHKHEAPRGPNPDDPAAPRSLSNAVKSLFDLLIHKAYLAAITAPPTRLPGWSFETISTVGCGMCQHCQALNAFLASPTESVWRYPALKQPREHLKRALSAHFSFLGPDASTNLFHIISPSGYGSRVREPFTVEKKHQNAIFEMRLRKWREHVNMVENLLKPLTRHEGLLRRILGDAFFDHLVRFKTVRSIDPDAESSNVAVTGVDAQLPHGLGTTDISVRGVKREPDSDSDQDNRPHGDVARMRFS